MMTSARNGAIGVGASPGVVSEGESLANSGPDGLAGVPGVSSALGVEFGRLSAVTAPEPAGRKKLQPVANVNSATQPASVAVLSSLLLRNRIPENIHCLTKGHVVPAACLPRRAPMIHQILAFSSRHCHAGR
jgi:hypothetical protein